MHCSDVANIFVFAVFRLFSDHMYVFTITVRTISTFSVSFVILATTAEFKDKSRMGLKVTSSIVVLTL